MKTINIIKSLLILGLALGISACDKYEYEEVVQTFKVVETNYSDGQKASEGFIRVNESGFTVSTDAAWLKAETVEEKLIKVSLSENKSEEARTANVILTKGDMVQRVPIMQMGQINYVQDLNDVTLDRDQLTKTFAVQLDNPAQIKLKAAEGSTAGTDWLKAEIKKGKLVLTAQNLPADLKPRELELNIEAGLYNKTIKVKQVWGKPKYEDILGKYTLEYVAGGHPLEIDPNADNPRVQAEVRIKKLKQGKSFILQGLAAPIRLEWDAENHILVIPTGVELKKPNSLKKNQILLLSASGNGYKNENGEADFNFYLDKEKYYFKGNWEDSTTLNDLKFDFPPVEVDGTKAYGLHFWIGNTETSENDGIYKGEDGNGIHTISEFSLTKKP